MKPLLQRPVLVGAVTFVFGLLIAAFAASWQGQRNERHAARQFDVLAGRVVADVSARMQTYEYGLRGVRGMAAAVSTDEDGTVGEQSFRRYSATRDVQREFPGARGFGLIWRVPQAEEAAFVERAKQAGAPGFAIRQFESHAGDRYVIRFISNPQNSADLGVDVASEAIRRGAAQRAMRTGFASLTAPIGAARAIGESAPSFLLLLPLYRPDTPLDTVEQREAATRGWSFAPLVIDDILRTIDGDASHYYTLALGDTDVAASGKFYDTSASAGSVVAGFERRLIVPVFGRVWAAEIKATPAFLQSLHQPPRADVAIAVALIGALCAVLAGVATRLANQTRSERIEQARRAVVVESVNASLERQVVERTAQLGTALHDLRAIVDALPSMIGYWDERLVNRVANRAYAEWFSRDAASVPGTNMADLLGAAHFARTRPHAEAALRGESQRFERAVQRPGLSPQHLVVHYVPDVREGSVRGFYVLVHDVSELIEGRLRLAAVQRDSEALLRTIEQHAIVTVADPSGRITEVNCFARSRGIGRKSSSGAIIEV